MDYNDPVELKTCLRYKGEPVVITDVEWMDQNILTVPIPSQVKIIGDSDSGPWSDWVSMNELSVQYTDREDW
jgi:hypothetical protein